MNYRLSKNYRLFVSLSIFLSYYLIYLSKISGKIFLEKPLVPWSFQNPGELSRFSIWVWVNTYRYISSGMNIHLPAILGFTRYQGFDPSPYGKCFFQVQQALGEAADLGWSTSCSLPIGPEDTPQGAKNTAMKLLGLTSKVGVLWSPLSFGSVGLSWFVLPLS